MTARLFVLTFASVVTLWANVTITTANLPAGTLGASYPTTQLAAADGTGALTWSVAGLPAGLELKGSTLSGLPTVSGAFQVAVTVKDSANPATQDTKTFALNIAGLVFDSAFCPAANGAFKPECELGETMVLKFKNLDQWCANKDNNLQSLELIIDGRLMPGLHPIAPAPCGNQLRFDLRRLDGDQDVSKQNRDAWAAILGGVKQDARLTDVNIGIEGKPVCFGSAKFTLRVFPWYKVWIYLGIALLVVVFLILAISSDLVRDEGPIDPGPTTNPNTPSGGRWRLGRLFGSGSGEARPTYSLARCQMAWWFLIVVGGYLYIWMVTGERDSLTSGVLILIGISAATGFSSVVIDSNKRDQRIALEKEEALLKKQLAELAAIVPPPADLQPQTQQRQARIAEIDKTLAGLPPLPGPSEGFLKDILRDREGVSFHRFQMAVWTVVLGGVFVHAVWQKLSMPDFSSTLLGLMGISAGTYVGFKIPDQPKATNPTVPAGQ